MMRTTSRLLLALLAIATIPARAVAQSADVVSLSAEERMRAIDSGDGRGADAALGGGTDGRKIHGEMGMMIGTGGARGLYGLTVIPLGDNATAMIGFETTRFGSNYVRR